MKKKTKQNKTKQKNTKQKNKTKTEKLPDSFAIVQSLDPSYTDTETSQSTYKCLREASSFQRKKSGISV